MTRLLTHYYFPFDWKQMRIYLYCMAIQIFLHSLASSYLRNLLQKSRKLSSKLYYIIEIPYQEDFIFPYIHNPTPMIIAMIIRPIKIGANISIRKIMTAIITINAIIPTIIAPILAVTKFSSNRYMLE